MRPPSGEPPRRRPSPGDIVPDVVERRTFRRRRLIDAACAVPLLGWILWWLPLFWQGPGQAVPASQALTYIFGTWLALALCAARLVLLIEQARIPEQGASAEERA